MPACIRASCATRKRPRRKYGLKTVDILVELGKRRMVGGQEDMIVDVALDLLKRSAHEQDHAEPEMSEAA